MTSDVTLCFFEDSLPGCPGVATEAKITNSKISAKEV